MPHAACRKTEFFNRLLAVTSSKKTQKPQWRFRGENSNRFELTVLQAESGKEEDKWLALRNEDSALRNC